MYPDVFNIQNFIVHHRDRAQNVNATKMGEKNTFNPKMRLCCLICLKQKSVRSYWVKHRFTRLCGDYVSSLSLLIEHEVV